MNMNRILMRQDRTVEVMELTQEQLKLICALGLDVRQTASMNGYRLYAIFTGDGVKNFAVKDTIYFW